MIKNIGLVSTSDAENATFSTPVRNYLGFSATRRATVCNKTIFVFLILGLQT